MKVQARMEDKVRIKNLKSLFAFFEKFGREEKRKKQLEESERERDSRSMALWSYKVATHKSHSDVLMFFRAYFCG